MLRRSYPYAYGNPAQNERIRLYGISERETRSDALRAVWRSEIQIQEQGILVPGILRRYGREEHGEDTGIHKAPA